MKAMEIGSEFWTGCSPVSKMTYTMRPGSIYKQHLFKVVETLSGRTALEHIVEILVGRRKKCAYLPSFCCHTMIEPFMKHGMEVLFYDVQLTSNGISRKIDRNDYDVILMMDYFGHTDAETIELARKEKDKGITTIYDATHSMYSDINVDPYDFVYGSYRKWVDINCGFLAWKEDLEHGQISQNDGYHEYAEIRRQLFDKKATFIKGGTIEKDEFFPLINEAEEVLERIYHHKLPDERSLEVLKNTDASFFKARRKDNARVLVNTIIEMNDERVRCITPVLNSSDAPLFVPVIIMPEIRNTLRRYLIENQIYCPVHWPLTEIHSLMSGSKQLFESEMSLICDQRYNADDMKRIADTIANYLKS